MNKGLDATSAGLLVTVNGVTYTVAEIVAPVGSTVTGATAIFASGPSGGSTGATAPEGPTGGAPSYAAAIVSHHSGDTVDVAPFVVAVRITPPPPVGTLVSVRRDAVQVGSAIVAGDTALVPVPTQTPGTYGFAARFVVNDYVLYSPTVILTVGDQVPEVTIVEPAQETDVPIGPLSVLMRVRHASALRDAFTVQAAFSDAFVSGVAAAVWESGEPTDAGGALFRATLQVTEEANYRVYGRAYDATPGGQPTVTGPTRVSSLPPYLQLQTAGATFNPRLEVAPGTTVLWTFSDGSTSTALAPAVNFGGAALRTHTLVVTPWSGLRFVNFGFDQNDDRGREALPLAYNHPNQNVVSMGNPGRASSLVGFLAAHCPLAGTLDLTGFDQLEWVECFQSALTDIRLDGCTRLRRLCVEQCNLSRLDIRPLASCLYDLRAAAQAGGALEITMTTMAIEYHFCVRSQVLTVRNAAGTVVTGDAFYSMLPAVEELWDFQDQRPGPCRPRSPYLLSVQCYQNQYDALDVAGQFPAGRNGEVLAYQNPFGAITIDRCPGLIRLDLRNCGLTTAQVDYVFLRLVEFGVTNGALVDLRGNAGPSAAGAANAQALVLRGWDEVYHEPIVVGGVNSDDFNRANGAVGNGWTSLRNGATATIQGNALVRTENAGYAIYGNAGSALPANVRVEADVTHATTNLGFFGVVARYASANGVRLLFTDRNTPTLGNASGWDDANVAITVTNGFPASWAANQLHTVGLSCVGTRCAIVVDGQEYGFGTVTTNAATTGAAYGCCGEGGGNHVYDRMAAIAL